MICTTRLSLACGAVREAMTSCRRLSISRAAGEAVFCMKLTFPIIGPSCSGDELHDAVELGLRRGARGHDIMQTRQYFAGGGGGCLLHEHELADYRPSVKRLCPAAQRRGRFGEQFVDDRLDRLLARNHADRLARHDRSVLYIAVDDGAA